MSILKDKNKRKGFTLIEVLVVIAIIGILAAIAIPQFASYRKKAQNSAAQTALRNLATSEENYYVAHNAYTGSTADLSNDWNLRVKRCELKHLAHPFTCFRGRADRPKAAAGAA